MYKCNICNREFKNQHNKNTHQKYCDGTGLTKKEKQKLYVPHGGKYAKGKKLVDILGKERAKEIGERISTSLKAVNGSPLTAEGREKKKEKLRIAINKRYENGWNPRCGRAKKYIYESPIAGKIQVDGLWELAVAKYLDSINVKWERNEKRFAYVNLLGKISKYKPDFYIFNWNTFLEIKGCERELDKCKWNQFKEPLKIWKKEDLIELKII